MNDKLSAYNVIADLMNEVGCVTCGGMGECNDADFGDISYSRWKCPECKGTGFTLNGKE
jgi:DnaJ-class molecular chaperone